MKRDLILLIPAASLVLLVGCASQESYSDRGPTHGAEVTTAPIVTPLVQLDPNQREQLRIASPTTLDKLEHGQPLDVADVTAMARAGVPDDYIINHIRDTHSVYYLTTQQIVDLSQAPVSTRVIDYMRSTPGFAGTVPTAVPMSLTLAQRQYLRDNSPATLDRFEHGQPLTVSDIEALSSAQVNADTIVDQIRATHCVYHLGSQDIVDLNRAGIPSRVIDCMRNTSVSYTTPGYATANSISNDQRDRLRRDNPDTWDRFEHDQRLSVADVEALSNAGVNSDVIVDHIRDSRSVYHLTTQDVLDLNRAGVNSQVVDYMLNTPRTFAYTPPPPAPDEGR